MSSTELDAALDDAERILLDSSSLIAFHSPVESAHAVAEHLLTRIADAHDPLRGYYALVSAVELLIRPIRTSQERFTFMHTFLTQYPNLTSLPLDMAVAVETATIRATTGLPVPDAMIIASGLLAGCDAVVTNDERWKTRCSVLFTQFRWIYLQDFA